MDKALVVYESMWGNTEKVARAVAEGLARIRGGGLRGHATRRGSPARTWT